jgi:hypothetical protein
LGITIDLKILFNTLISVFRLPIYLWVISCGHVLCCTHKLAEHLGEVDCQLGISMGNDSLGDSIVRENMLGIDLHQSLSHDFFGARQKDSHF